MRLMKIVMKKACLFVLFFVLFGCVGVGYGVCEVCGGDVPANITRWIHHFADQFNRDVLPDYGPYYRRVEARMDRNFNFATALTAEPFFRRVVFKAPRIVGEEGPRDLQIFWHTGAHGVKPLRYMIPKDIVRLHEGLEGVQSQDLKNLLGLLFFPSIFYDTNTSLGRRSLYGIKSIKLYFSRAGAQGPEESLDVELLEPNRVGELLDERMVGSIKTISAAEYLTPIRVLQTEFEEHSPLIRSRYTDNRDAWVEHAASRCGCCCCSGRSKVNRARKVMEVFRRFSEMVSSAAIRGFESAVFIGENVPYVIHLGVRFTPVEGHTFVGGVVVQIDESGNAKCFFVRPMAELPVAHIE